MVPEEIFGRAFDVLKHHFPTKDQRIGGDMRIRTGLALLIALVVGVIVGFNAPAQAAVNDCPLGNFCIWTGYNYTGTRYTIAYNSINGGTRHGYRLGTLASNHGRAFFNRTTVAMNIYDDGTCGYYPWTRTLAAGQYADAQGSDWADRVSSVQVKQYAPNC